jgi:hypothetical protein
MISSFLFNSAAILSVYYIVGTMQGIVHEKQSYSQVYDLIEKSYRKLLIQYLETYTWNLYQVLWEQSREAFDDKGRAA